MVYNSESKRKTTFYATISAARERKLYVASKNGVSASGGAYSGYMGKLKERAQFFVKLIEACKVRSALNRDETRWVYNFYDQNYNLGAFFSSADPDTIIGEDGACGKMQNRDCLLIEMTPVAHEINSWHQNPYTLFRRPKIIANYGQPSVDTMQPETSQVYSLALTGDRQRLAGLIPLK